MKTTRILSYFRKLYHGRFIFRCVAFFATLLLYFFAPAQFDVMEGFNFFKTPSLFHLLWIFWMVDMILQLRPAKNYWPIGSQKFLKACFTPMLNMINREGLLQFIKKCRRDVLNIALVWVLLIGSVGALYFGGIIPRNMLMVFTAAFYVLDVVFVLFWCPFRVWFMKNRCCTTCRIFNWDHMMMFSPIVFIPGFYTWTLCAMSIVVLLAWEVSFAIHPERFWDGSNSALRCSNCTDRLCGERNCTVDLPELKMPKKKD